MARALACGAIIGLLACSGPTPEASRAPVSRDPGRPVTVEPPPAPIATAAAEAAPERRMPQISFQRGRLILDGRFLDHVAPLKVEKAPLLFNALLDRSERWTSEDTVTYSLAMEAEAFGGQLKSIVRTAAAADWPVARFGSGDFTVALHADVELPAHLLGAPPKVVWPERVVAVVVRPLAIELWRVPMEKSPANARNIGEVRADDALDGLVRLLEPECRPEEPCNPAVLFVADDAKVARVNQALRALATVVVKKGEAPLAKLRFDEPPAIGAPLVQGVSAKPVSGRLPPEAIQRALRASFHKFRGCYEQGLRQNPHLKGKVAARFVIGLDGKVSDAAADRWATSMPDAEVTKCVVAAMKALEFPAPEGGTVTVVYPFIFSPGQ